MLETEKEWFIEAPWGRICIVAWGSCTNPPVLLCHGNIDSAASWRPLIEKMPDKFYYIGMELPGNGRSDPFPKGLMLSAHDLVYSIELVRKHFRWDQFVLIAHSMGAALGKQYISAYPGKISKVVDFDPIPAYTSISPDKFASWYIDSFTKYYEKYHIYNASKENAPVYTREKALSQLERDRGLTGAAAAMVLDRLSEPVGEGHVRYTYDQRNKVIVRAPYTTDQIKNNYTNMTTPTLTIVASDSVKRGAYSKMPFVLDEKCYPHNNYRVLQVEGNHDLHVIHPERVAAFVERFLLYGLDGLDRKAKL